MREIELRVRTLGIDDPLTIELYAQENNISEAEASIQIHNDAALVEASTASQAADDILALVNSTQASYNDVVSRLNAAEVTVNNVSSGFDTLSDTVGSFDSRIANAEAKADGVVTDIIDINQNIEQINEDIAGISVQQYVPPSFVYNQFNEPTSHTLPQAQDTVLDPFTMTISTDANSKVLLEYSFMYEATYENISMLVQRINDNGVMEIVYSPQVEGSRIGCNFVCEKDTSVSSTPNAGYIRLIDTTPNASGTTTYVVTAYCPNSGKYIYINRTKRDSNANSYERGTSLTTATEIRQ